MRIIAYLCKVKRKGKGKGKYKQLKLKEYGKKK